MFALFSPPDDSERMPGMFRKISAVVRGAKSLISSNDRSLTETLLLSLDRRGPATPVTTIVSRSTPRSAADEVDVCANALLVAPSRVQAQTTYRELIFIFSPPAGGPGLAARSVVSVYEIDCNSLRVVAMQHREETKAKLPERDPLLVLSIRSMTRCVDGLYELAFAEV